MQDREDVGDRRLGAVNRPRASLALRACGDGQARLTADGDDACRTSALGAPKPPLTASGHERSSFVVPSDAIDRRSLVLSTSVPKPPSGTCADWHRARRSTTRGTGGPSRSLQPRACSGLTRSWVETRCGRRRVSRVVAPSVLGGRSRGVGGLSSGWTRGGAPSPRSRASAAGRRTCSPVGGRAHLRHPHSRPQGCPQPWTTTLRGHPSARQRPLRTRVHERALSTGLVVEVVHNTSRRLTRGWVDPQRNGRTLKFQSPILVTAKRWRSACRREEPVRAALSHRPRPRRQADPEWSVTKE